MHGDLDALDARWSSLPVPSTIVIASVAADDVSRRLRKSLGCWKTVPHWASSARSQCGVLNRYDEPSQLGIDRWAALIGARKISSDSCVVVNAGTAMTVDALTAKGEFIGGIIVPGFELMHETLAVHTAGLSADQGKFTPLPLTTRDAITSGAIQALCGAVDRMRDAMLTIGAHEPGLIFSGGAGELVSRYMGRPVRIVDKLVLEGLVQIALEPQ